MNLVIGKRDWREIVAFYRNLVSIKGWKVEPMLMLVERIAASRYSNGLFATTSLATLWVSKNQESLARQVDWLRIEAKNGRLRFEFRETSDEPVAWSRECEAAEGFDVLEHFVRDLKRWFTREYDEGT